MTTAQRAATARPIGGRPHSTAPGAMRVSARAGATLGSDAMTGRQIALLAVEGSLVGCAILAVVALGWYFLGDTLRERFEPIPLAGPTAPAAAGKSTTFYRDRGDGTVMVMEIDGNGTRIKGTMSRTQVPMILEDQVDSQPAERPTLSSQSRVHALGSAFR